MIARRRLWRLCLAGIGGLAGAAMTTVLCYAQALSPRPAPGPLTAVAVPLDPAHPTRTHLGAFTYAGGLMLSAGSSSRFGGLSGLTVEPDAGGRTLTINAISDEGGIARFTATLDAQDHLAGAADLRFTDVYEDGRAVGRGKAHGDSEDIARADGLFYVSFEYTNRVLALDDPFDPAAKAQRVRLPKAALDLPTGEGLEALAAATIDGADLLALGAEDGPVWLCPREVGEAVQADCPQIIARPPDPDFRLTALAQIPDGPDFVALYRAFDPVRGWRARVELLAKGPRGYALNNLARLSPPMTVDNMEGIAILPTADNKGWRLYLISDDNFRPEERTLLMAFDWRRP